MLKKTLQITFVVSCFLSQQAFAYSMPETLGYNATLEAASQVFSSPALPSLDNDGLAITPLYGIDTIVGVDEQMYSVDGTPLETVKRTGQFKGQIAGLNVTWTRGDFGLFATTAWSQVSGAMTMTDSHSTSDIRDVKAQSFIGALGVSYRLTGDSSSHFAMGLFGGPAMIKSNTSSRIVQADGTSTTVTLNPQIQGYYIGLQMMIRLGEFRINPYMNMLGNPSAHCEQVSYSGDPYPIAQYQKCMNGDHGVDTMTVMGGAGVNIGYGRFGFGLVKTATATDIGLKSTPLMGSFRISL